MFQRSGIDPTRGIILATGIILLVSGTRLIMKWDELSFWSDAGMFAALLVGGAAALLIAIAYVLSRTKPTTSAPERRVIEIEGQAEERRQ